MSTGEVRSDAGRRGGHEDRGRGRPRKKSRVFGRPAVLLVLVVVIGMFTVLFALLAVGTHTDTHRMASAEICATASDDHCLERVPGYLDGPGYKKGPGSRWALRDGAEMAHGFDSFTMPTQQSLQLEAVGGDTVVNGLAWERDIVAVELPDKTWVKTDAFGDSGWLKLALFAAFSLAGALVATDQLAIRRRGGVRWWSADTWGVDDWTSTRWMAVGALLFLTSVCGLLPLMFVGSFVGALVGTGVGLVLGTWAMTAVWRRSTRRAPTVVRPRG